MNKILSTLALSALIIFAYKAPVGLAAAPEKPVDKFISVEVNKGKMIKLSKAASSVLLANPEIADVEAKSPTQIFVFGKAIGETTIYAYDDKDHEVLSSTIKVTHNISSLGSSVKQAIPDSDVKLNSSDKGLVISGDVNSPQDAENVMRLVSGYTTDKEPVINIMNVKGSEQVTLRVRVAEVQKTNLKNFGINLQNMLTRGTFALGLATGRDFIDEVSTTTPIVLPSNSDALIFQHGATHLNGMLEALEREGFARTLAEPNLTTISGKPANFLAGGEIPIPVPGDNGTVTIEYRQFGVVLNFTPTVMNNKRISLTVSPEVSALSQTGAITYSGFSVPSFTVRRATSTVELGSGQSIALAGLLQSDSTNDVSKFPWLGDIPVLGTLFKSTSFQNNETELVIIVTPYIVNPVDDKDIALPGENIVHSSDFERIFLGKLFDYRAAPASIKDSRVSALESSLPAHHGKIGYILE